MIVSAATLGRASPESGGGRSQVNREAPRTIEWE